MRGGGRREKKEVTEKGEMKGKEWERGGRVDRKRGMSRKGRKERQRGR